MLLTLGLMLLALSIVISLISMTAYPVEYTSQDVYVSTSGVEVPAVLGIPGGESILEPVLSATNIGEQAVYIEVFSVFNESAPLGGVVQPGETVNFTLNHIFYYIKSSGGARLSLTLRGFKMPFIALSILSLIAFIAGTVISAISVYAWILEKSLGRASKASATPGS